MSETVVGVLGARSLVGDCLLKRLSETGRKVAAFTREVPNASYPAVDWYRPDPKLDDLVIPDWICLAPIWVLPEYYRFFERCGARRVVALSSTSRFSKTDSADPGEQAVSRRLAEAEEDLIKWAIHAGVDWCILRPTLIYGYGQDRNIAELARMIRRFRIFPLLGEAMGLRQPVHADDVAQAALAALEFQGRIDRSYNLSGGEILPYREMIERIFVGLRIKPRFISLPLPLFRFAMSLLRLLPRYRHWNSAMAERMSRDLVFEHGDAVRDLALNPRAFHPGSDDLAVGSTAAARRHT